MARLLRVIFILALFAPLTGPLAWGQIRIIPEPPHVQPQWTPIPEIPGAYYAPNLPTDLFRYRGRYFLFWNGYLYKGRTARGPWKFVRKNPAFFARIAPAYFKTAGRTGGPMGPPGAGAPGTPPSQMIPAPSPGPVTSPGTPTSPAIPTSPGEEVKPGL